MVSLTSWAISDIGRKRAKNEDSYYHDQDLGLFMVADGMGGHKGGEQASKIAIKAAAETFRKKIMENSPVDVALGFAFASAAKLVHRTSLTNNELKGMGTTLSALAIIDDRAFIAHIGDSRIYRCQENSLQQLTSDHSLVYEQVQAGVMSKEEARISSLRNIITRAIGHDEHIQIDRFSVSLKKNDMFLLCSDGLNNMLLDREIVEIISHLEPDRALKELVLEANLRGGEDNITIILVKACL